MTELTTCVLVVRACDRPTSASLAESSEDSRMLALFRLQAASHSQPCVSHILGSIHGLMLQSVAQLLLLLVGQMTALKPMRWHLHGLVEQAEGRTRSE